MPKQSDSGMQALDYDDFHPMREESRTYYVLMATFYPVTWTDGTVNVNVRRMGNSYPTEAKARQALEKKRDELEELREMAARGDALPYRDRHLLDIETLDLREVTDVVRRDVTVIGSLNMGEHVEARRVSLPGSGTIVPANVVKVDAP